LRAHGRHLEAFDALLAPDFTNHDPNNPAATDLASLKQSVQGSAKHIVPYPY
jgi:hypothetical protein